MEYESVVVLFFAVVWTKRAEDGGAVYGGDEIISYAIPSRKCDSVMNSILNGQGRLALSGYNTSN